MSRLSIQLVLFGGKAMNIIAISPAKRISHIRYEINLVMLRTLDWLEMRRGMGRLKVNDDIKMKAPQQLNAERGLLFLC